MIGQAQGAAEQMRAEMDLLKSQMDALSNRQQQEMVQLQHLMNRYTEASNLVSNIVKAQHDMADGIIRNLRA